MDLARYISVVSDLCEHLMLDEPWDAVAECLVSRPPSVATFENWRDDITKVWTRVPNINNVELDLRGLRDLSLVQARLFGDVLRHAVSTGIRQENVVLCTHGVRTIGERRILSQLSDALREVASVGVNKLVLDNGETWETGQMYLKLMLPVMVDAMRQANTEDYRPQTTGTEFETGPEG